MKRVYVNISGMSCQGCMNIVKNTLMKVEGVVDVEVELVPGSAKIICDENVKSAQLVSSINENTSYKASLQKEEDVLEEELKE
ncbi:cation transporter [Thermospira aquatica]|uniref:Cation transporter n=1 Tax=Thermospira aquatica TaxID=2828656 RepID=A0AAX3BG62_9SPIR|nr:cation transporter [Thermospira aquatica]URA11265.1 cation transporter [Thermospira aquatica]